MDYALIGSFASLTALEIVLGIDNVVFIALLVGHLPEAQKNKARIIGLVLALLMRIGMLFGVAWIIGLKDPWLNVMGHGFSGKDLLMLAGGLFLLHKATDSIHNELTQEHVEHYQSYKGGFVATIVQIVMIDIVFSFDSVITAVGITEHLPVIIAAMTIAMMVMLASSGMIAGFIAKHPTLKMLALSFVMMIGMLLVADGLGVHVPKGYIYFAMSFSLGVEILNLVVRKKRGK
ncbi:MAG: TerC family protein [Alphaproteobacteria bacterium]|nr:MAG: TerC family protein [Alphaproteobacteria bacterium]TAF41869.1 MAG: TerC family protein [Alphaproteobacteria bacterium]TAF77224.1 MAG: TerC family protein [Alphaproteobacteria bacterium]